MRTPTKVGLAAASLVAVLALARVVVGLARSWASIWEHYHREVLAGYDDLDQLTDADQLAAYRDGFTGLSRADLDGLATTASRERLADAFRQMHARLTEQVEPRRMIWPVDDPEHPRFEPDPDTPKGT